MLRNTIFYGLAGFLIGAGVGISIGVFINASTLLLLLLIAIFAIPFMLLGIKYAKEGGSAGIGNGLEKLAISNFFGGLVLWISLPVILLIFDKSLTRYFLFYLSTALILVIINLYTYFSKSSKISIHFTTAQIILITYPFFYSRLFLSHYSR